MYSFEPNEKKNKDVHGSIGYKWMQQNAAEGGNCGSPTVASTSLIQAFSIDMFSSAPDSQHFELKKNLKYNLKLNFLYTCTPSSKCHKNMSFSSVGFNDNLIVLQPHILISVHFSFCFLLCVDLSQCF